MRISAANSGVWPSEPFIAVGVRNIQVLLNSQGRSRSNVAMVEEEDGKTEPVFWGKKWHEGDLRPMFGLGMAWEGYIL